MHTHSTQRLLLVDDSRVARLTLAHILKQTGLVFEIDEAANAEEALELFAQNTYDLALIDFNMPGMNGLELSEHLLQTSPTLKILLVTANIQESIQERAAALGLRFVGKPASPEELLTAIRS